MSARRTYDHWQPGDPIYRHPRGSDDGGCARQIIQLMDDETFPSARCFIRPDPNALTPWSWLTPLEQP